MSWITIAVLYDGTAVLHPATRDEDVEYVRTRIGGDSWKTIVDGPDFIVEEWQGQKKPNYNRYFVMVRE